jgi:Ca2+-dependent lipid-binding protein
MGCIASDTNAPKALMKKETVFGTLEIKVLEAHLERETSKLISLDPYVNVTFSNQKKTGTVIEKGGKDPKFSDIFKFTVNSCYKVYGRSLSIELKDSNTAIDTLIGHGIVDL